MPSETVLDAVATDLATWIDQTATRIAAAMAPQGIAPFSADLSETQKLEYYRDQLFNADGSPNLQGRQAQMQRLGPQSFTMVYKSVIKAFPSLRLPTPPGMPNTLPPQATPAAPPSGVPAPAVPRGMLTAPNPNITPVVPFATGGIVTQPTVALIGEAGPEAIVPLQGQPGPSAVLQNALPTYQPPPDPDLAAHLGNTPGPDVTPPTPSAGEIQAYIVQAAQQRGIDPKVALAVAQHEGTNPKTGQFDSPAQQGTFSTGQSFWPFQLHYGGAGTPYAQYGSVAGMGNDFTAQTGWQPGDPRAWKDSVDFALDQAIANPKGWALWYGSGPAGVSARQGLPNRRTA